jgi:hypothetical protein
MKKKIVCCLSDDAVSKDMERHHNPELDNSDSDSDSTRVGLDMM